MFPLVAGPHPSEAAVHPRLGPLQAGVRAGQGRERQPDLVAPEIAVQNGTDRAAGLQCYTVLHSLTVSYSHILYLISQFSPS